MLSVLLYVAGAWTEVEDHGIQLLERAYVAMARCMLQKHREQEGERISGERVLARLQLPSIRVLLHVARLSYLASFLTLDITCSWALAHAEGRWLRHVAESLQWLWEEVDAGKRHASWQAAWAIWQDAVPKRPRWWRRLIRFAKESACRREGLSEAWQFYRGTFLRRLLATGAMLPDVPEEQRMPGEVCIPCGKMFDSKQAWSVHAFKVHGKVRPERSLVDGVACPVCLRTFASNMRLCRHVQHTSRCRDVLKRRGSCNPVGPGVGSKRSRCEEDLPAPAMQGMGPLPADADAQMVAGVRSGSECCSDTLGVLQDMLSLETPGCGLCDLIEAARSALSATCLSLAGIMDTVRAWREAVEDADDDSYSVRWSALRRACVTWVSDNGMPWLCPHIEASRRQMVHTFAHSEAALSWLDFSLVEVQGLCVPDEHGGFLLCHDAWVQAFRSTGRSWSVCFESRAALTFTDWKVEGYARMEQRYAGLY